MNGRFVVYEYYDVWECCWWKKQKLRDQTREMAGPHTRIKTETSEEKMKFLIIRVALPQPRPISLFYYAE